jgi:type I restriction enzyme S subunit
MTLPAGWTSTTVGDVIRRIEAGKSEQSLERQPSGDDVGVVKVSAVTWGEFNPAEAKAIGRDRFDTTKSIREGDLLFSRANTVELVGAVVHVGEDHPRLMLSDKILRLVVDDTVESRYLMFALRTAESRRHLEERATGTSTSMRNVSQDALRETPLLLPPLNEQRRIVAKLDSIFEQTRAAKSRLERVPALLERLERSILAAAFSGALTADWRAAHPDVEPASALLCRLRDEHRRRWENAVRAKGKMPSLSAYRPPTALVVESLGELPPGWTWASVDDLAELQLGQQRAPVHANAEKTYPYVRAANIKWDGLDLSDVKEMGFPDPERYQLRYGDVLLSEASGSASEVGKPAIWRDEIPGCCYQKTLLRARPRSADVTSEWLHAAFLADALLGRFARMAPGVGILHLTADRMLGWPVPLAPVEEQRVLVERLQSALASVAGLERTATRALQDAERLEQATLVRAFRGELVQQDPNDESASALLDRLRNNVDVVQPRPARQSKPPTKRARVGQRQREPSAEK